MAHPVGTGPFRLAEWRRSAKIVLERNPNYRDDAVRRRGRADDAGRAGDRAKFTGRVPFVDRVEISIIEETQPRWLAFLNGEHDLIDRLPNEFATIATPNNKLAPNLAKQGVRMERVPLVDATLCLFRHGAPGGRRLHAPQGGAAPRDRAGLRRGTARSPWCAAARRFRRRASSRRCCRATTQVEDRDERVRPAARQGPARPVRLHRQERRRLARPARRLAAAARILDRSPTSCRVSSRSCGRRR